MTIKPVTIPAHFDGKHIVLDEPYPLKADMKLVVAILEDENVNGDDADWHRTAMQHMAKLQEDEPDYADAVITKPNPSYHGR